MTRYIIFLFILFILFSGVQAGAEASKVFDAKKIQSEIAGDFQRHNYKKVVQLYKNFVEDSIESPSLATKTLYSESLANTGEIDEAIQIIQEIIGELPAQVDPVTLKYNLANLLFIQKRYNEAVQVYRKILLQTSQYADIAAKARDRLALMRNKEGKKKDVLSL